MFRWSAHVACIYYYAVENLIERSKRGNQDGDREIGCIDLNLTELAKDKCLRSRELTSSTRKTLSAPVLELLAHNVRS
jgi:hypothetical protein